LKKIEKSEKVGFFCLFYRFLAIFWGFFRVFRVFINEPIPGSLKMIGIEKVKKNAIFIDFYRFLAYF
jgi:hypothetical protein